MNETNEPIREAEALEKRMGREEIVSEVKALVESLQLPENSYVVFGSGPLAVAGIRPAKDVDMLASQAVLDILKANGWQELHKGPGDIPLVSGIFEVHGNWNFSPYAPTLEHLLQSAEVIEGVPFASLEEVKKWKTASGGAKHMADVEAIDRYLEKAKNTTKKRFEDISWEPAEEFLQGEHPKRLSKEESQQLGKGEKMLERGRETAYLINAKQLPTVSPEQLIKREVVDPIKPAEYQHPDYFFIQQGQEIYINDINTGKKTKAVLKSSNPHERMCEIWQLDKLGRVNYRKTKLVHQNLVYVKI